MASIKDKKGKRKFIGVRVLFDEETYSLIMDDKLSNHTTGKFGFTYAVKCLVHKALGVTAPPYPNVAMSLGGKKSRELAAKKKRASKKGNPKGERLNVARLSQATQKKVTRKRR
jgi:hypothetical protein